MSPIWCEMDINGFLVDRNPKDISSKLECLRDMSVWQKMSQNMRDEVIENWGWNKNAPKWHKFIWDKIGANNERQMG